MRRRLAEPEPLALAALPPPPLVATCDLGWFFPTHRAAARVGAPAWGRRRLGHKAHLFHSKCHPIPFRSVRLVPPKSSPNKQHPAPHRPSPPRSLRSCRRLPSPRSTASTTTTCCPRLRLYRFGVSKERREQRRNHQAARARANLPTPPTYAVGAAHGGGGGAAALLLATIAGAVAMGLVGGVLGFCIGLHIGLAAAYLVYLRYFAARRLHQVTISSNRLPPTSSSSAALRPSSYITSNASCRRR